MNNRAGAGIDFAEIRDKHPIADTVGRYLELKRRGGEYLARCPFHADKRPSFAVVPSKGKAFCNACGWHGDVVDFIAEFERIDTKEAARRLTGDELPTERPALPELPPDEAGDWRALMPVPDDAPRYDPGTTYNPRRAKRVNWARIITRQDVYRDDAGRLLGYVCRLEIDGDKLTPTVVYAEHKDGRREWISGRFPSPRPLQGLDVLAARPGAPVLIVSGEKCRDVAQRVLPGFVAMTWPGGDQAEDLADWTPLHGRAVTFWPDADKSGVDAMVRIAARLHGSGKAAPVRILDVTAIGEAFGKGSDVADTVAAGWDTSRIVGWARTAVREYTPEVEGHAAGIEPATANPEPAGQGRADDHANPKQAAGPSGGEGESRAAADSPGDDTTADRTAAAAVEEHATPVAPPATTGATASATTSAPELAERTSRTPPPAGSPKRVSGQVVDLPNDPPTAYSTIVTWSQLGLELSDKGIPHPNLDNAAALLERHPDMQGRFWFDEFLQRILSTWNIDGEPREWTDSDDVRLALWMQRRIKIGRMAVGTARDAVTAVAMAHRRNECQDWLRSLVWDKKSRLSELVPTGFRAANNAYTQAVGRCWLVSMVARVLDPGCKVDTMPVFEGVQGERKSSALELLAGKRWFAEGSNDPTKPDFFLALQGKMLVEVAEMDAFSRSEVTTIKRVISCKVDRYRAPYGRRTEDHPRMSVFAGTTNKDDWNRDETGARRFWPIACLGPLDHDWIRDNREQLFAEAVARYQAGEPWWDVPDADAKREQEARRTRDAWEPVIDAWLAVNGRYEVTVGDVLGQALKIDTERWDRAAQMRAAGCLRDLGWIKADAWRGGKTVKVWTAPDIDGEGGKGSNELDL